MTSYRIITKNMNEEGRAFELAIQVLDIVLMPAEILFSSNGGKYTLILKLSRTDLVSAVELVCEYMTEKGWSGFSEIFKTQANNYITS